jgi:magnesium and cobalt transporter
MTDNDMSPPAKVGEDAPDEDSRQPFFTRLKMALAVLFARSEDDETPTKSGSRENDAQQRALLANVRKMGDKRVSDAMVTRADVVGIEANTPFDEVMEVFRKAGHSRLPVFRDTLDDPLGFIHVKDLFMAFGAQSVDAGAIQGFKAANHLRRTLTVPPSMPCGTLLQAMQAQRMHMALVIDEYGGVDGLITIEDLLELIVGEIEDEHDTANDATWRLESDGSYRAAARTYLDDFEEETGITLLNAQEEDVDTLGGLVFWLCNRIPARGEVIRHPDGHEFEILDADPRRIKRLRVTLVDPSGAGADQTRQAAE